MFRPSISFEEAISSDSLLSDVVTGLGRRPKTLPTKLLYDQQGSELFDEICTLPEYYPARTEMRILRQSAGEIADRIGPEATIIEPGAGSSVKIRLLLDALDQPACFVPIDISAEHLHKAAAEIQSAYPDLEVWPVVADFTSHVELPRVPKFGRVVAFFPGSTIGNFHPQEAVAFLRRLTAWVGPGGGLLIGVDLLKETNVLEAAYNDSRGVTAAFNRNILSVLNQHFDCDLDPWSFEHRAVFVPASGRIEMRLISTVAQEFQVAGRSFALKPGEFIVTEYCYKYSLEDFARLARRAGFAVQHIWQDPRRWFSVQYLIAD